MPQLQLAFASGETSLDVRHFDVHESVSNLFSVSIRARSANADLDLEALVGKDTSFRIVGGLAYGRAPTRRWTGVCSHIEQIQAEPTGLSTYHLRIVPTLWLLTQRRNHRLYQHLSIPDIADEILGEWGVAHTWRVARASYPKLEYKCQYGESDYTFLSRLFEGAGLAFTLPDDDDQGSVLTLSDALHLGAPRPPPNLPHVDKPNQAAELEFITNVALAHEVRPGAHVVRDYDFRNPAFALFGQAQTAAPPEDKLEQYHYLPGSVLVGASGASASGDTPVADDKGPYRYDPKYATDLAQRALDGRRASRRTVTFESNALDMAPGVILSTDNHPHAELDSDKQLLVTEVQLRGAVGAEWTRACQAVFAHVPYRPHRKTPKPDVTGVQSATVVGRSGQEIDVDELGRVRVQFPWDREGQNDDGSSVWIRVSQGWAGTGFGLINLPRVGQEVLIGFLGGDPDQPVVVGRVFNNKNPVPYTLPEHKTRSTWKSNSSPASGGAGGFNEVMFEDLAGQELVFMQAQKNQRRLVKNDETITIGNDRQKLVKRNEVEVTQGNRSELTHGNRVELTEGDRTTIIGGTFRKLVNGDEVERSEKDRLTFVGGDQHLVVMGEKRERIEKDSHLSVGGSRNEAVGAHSLSVGGDQHDKVGKNYALETGDELHLKAGTDLVLEAVSDLTIKGPGGFIRIDAGGVTIMGTLVKINSGGGPGSGAKPRVHTVQSALVVGPPGQDIHTDELGRIRVQLPWDREGQSDDESSIWMRVSQEWAGTGFGMINLPRIGQEVLVAFLDGDPDQPIVVGRLFDVTNPVPYRLPDNETRSAWKSNTSPGSSGWNEILLEDLDGSELVYQQAQKNLRRLVKHDETITVVEDRTKLIAGSETDTTIGDRIVKDFSLEVKGSLDESFGGYSLSTGSQQEKIGKKNELETGLALHEKAGTVLVAEGTSSVTIKGPGGFITIDAGGVTISGTLVLINVSGSPGSAPDAKPAGPEKPTDAQIDPPPEPPLPTLLGPP